MNSGTLARIVATPGKWEKLFSNPKDNVCTFDLNANNIGPSLTSIDLLITPIPLDLVDANDSDYRIKSFSLNSKQELVRKGIVIGQFDTVYFRSINTQVVVNLSGFVDKPAVANTTTPYHFVAVEGGLSKSSKNIVSFVAVCENISNGSNIPYTISGIAQSRISNIYVNGVAKPVAMTGNFVINNGYCVVRVVLATNTVTDAGEKITITTSESSVSKTLNYLIPSISQRFSILANKTHVTDSGALSVVASGNNIPNGTEVSLEISDYSLVYNYQEVISSTSIGGFIKKIIYNPIDECTWVLTDHPSDNTLRKAKKIDALGTVSEYQINGQPIDFCHNPFDNSIWVTHNSLNGVQIIASNGSSTNLTLPNAVYSVCHNPFDNSMWVASQTTASVYKVSTGGAVTTIALPFLAYKVMCYNPIDNSIWVGFNPAHKTLYRIAKTLVVSTFVFTTTVDIGSHANNLVFNSLDNKLYFCYNDTGGTFSKIRNVSVDGVFGDEVNHAAVHTGIAFNPLRGSIWLFSGTSPGIVELLPNGTFVTNNASPLNVNTFAGCFNTGNKKMYVGNYGTSTVMEVQAGKYLKNTNLSLPTNKIDDLTISNNVSSFNGFTFTGIINDEYYALSLILRDAYGTPISDTKDILVVKNVASLNVETITYSVSASNSTVNEGAAITFNLLTSGVTNGTLVPFVISGSANNSDFSGLAGMNFVVNNNVASVGIFITNDGIAEGQETVTVSLVSNPSISATVTINDVASTPSGLIISSIQLANNTTPSGICHNPVDNSIYVSGSGSGNVQKIASNNTVTNLGIVSQQYGICHNPVDNTVWVTSYNMDSVVKIEANGTKTTIGLIASFSPIDICHNPSDNSIWVASYSSYSVAKISSAGVVTYIPINCVSSTKIKYNAATNTIWVSSIWPSTAGTPIQIIASNGTVTELTYLTTRGVEGLVYDMHYVPENQTMLVATKNLGLAIVDSSNNVTFYTHTGETYLKYGSVCYNPTSKTVWLDITSQPDANIGNSSILIVPYIGGVFGVHKTITMQGTAADICHNPNDNTMWVAVSTFSKVLEITG